MHILRTDPTEISHPAIAASKEDMHAVGGGRPGATRLNLVAGARRGIISSQSPEENIGGVPRRRLSPAPKSRGGAQTKCVVEVLSMRRTSGPAGRQPSSVVCRRPWSNPPVKGRRRGRRQVVGKAARSKKQEWDAQATLVEMPNVGCGIHKVHASLCGRPSAVQPIHPPPQKYLSRRNEQEVEISAFPTTLVRLSDAQSVHPSARPGLSHPTRSMMRIVCHLGFSTWRKHGNRQCCTCLDGAGKTDGFGHNLFEKHRISAHRGHDLHSPTATP
ncbi:hypothetical protein B0T18DRAFT_210707 [Schizothecium vesticola]|uniref:Uncharacterized protein n=1 Tax=Schizothecium vesticola TaxID=314040 RepID=A0AA40EJK4_9PEZI|nr:hypothetical protein B0T18DRAFT_210707 [Schizothecium vesticola]